MTAHYDGRSRRPGASSHCRRGAAFQCRTQRYHLRVVTTALERRKLSPFATYILRAVKVGVASPAALAHLLGLTEADLAGPAAELLQAHLLTHGEPDATGRRPLALTQRGNAYLADEANLAVPRTWTAHVHYDPLTRELHPYDRAALGVDEIRRRGDFVLPNEGGPPGAADIRLQDLRAALTADPQHPPEIAVAGVVDLLEPYAEYLTGLTVFLMRHRQSGDECLAVFRAGRHLVAESEALQRLRGRGVNVLPADAERPKAAALDILGLLPPAAAHVARRLLANDDRLYTGQRALALAEAALPLVADRRERQTMEAGARRLREELSSLEDARAALRRELGEATGEAVDVLRAEQHRPVLEEALRQAGREVVILSPWLSIRVLDRGLCDLIAGALRRGVRVRVGFGFGHFRDGAEGERNRQLAQAVRDQLGRCEGPGGRGILDVRDLGDVAENLLLCDDSFAVVTTYRWLAQGRDVDRDLAPATGILVRDHDAVRRAANRATGLWKAAEHRVSARGMTSRQ